MPGWNTIEDMFLRLNNKNWPYVILRNYEEIEEGSFYSSEHPDIDFLTTDGRKFAQIIQAHPRFVKDDGIHYKVVIAGTEVMIDVRSVGDGYYDAKWEKNILSDRILKNNLFYIVDDMNYYYSLAYHAILQKKALTAEYLGRLNQMALGLQITAMNERQHLDALAYFMKEKAYCYTIPYDIHVPLRREMIDGTMIKYPINVKMRDAGIKLMQLGSKVKRAIFPDIGV